MRFTVTADAQRPADMNGCCFYCGQKIGSEHLEDCVLIHKTVRVRMIAEYDVRVPAFWSPEQVEFHRNSSGWCASNAIRELEERFGWDSPDRVSCGCRSMSFEAVQDLGDVRLEEK